MGLVNSFCTFRNTERTRKTLSFRRAFKIKSSFQVSSFRRKGEISVNFFQSKIYLKVSSKMIPLNLACTYFFPHLVKLKTQEKPCPNSVPSKKFFYFF